MISDFLSQEEIDALLSKPADNDDQKEEEKDEGQDEEIKVSEQQADDLLAEQKLGDDLSQAEIDKLLSGIGEDEPEEEMVPDPPFKEEKVPSTSPTKRKEPVAMDQKANVDLILDVPFRVTVVLGGTEKSLESVLEMGPGTIVDVDKEFSQPVELRVNNKVIAKGEVIVLDEYYGLKVTHILSQVERVNQLR